jgi:hypothetical protein
MCQEIHEEAIFYSMDMQAASETTRERVEVFFLRGENRAWKSLLSSSMSHLSKKERI